VDFWTDIGFAVLLRLLKDRRELKKYRAAFLKLAQTIILAYHEDADFQNDVRSEKPPWMDHPTQQ
jgi:hypothetical protein